MAQSAHEFFTECFRLVLRYSSGRGRLARLGQSDPREMTHRAMLSAHEERDGSSAPILNFFVDGSATGEKL